MSVSPFSRLPNYVDPEHVRVLLCRMQAALRDCIIEERNSKQNDELAAVAEQTPADTIYAIDKAVEQVVVDWLEANWPSRWPIHLVMEGLEERGTILLPSSSKTEAVMTLIIDPVDGTRGLMYDKRAAWCLSGVAAGPSDVARVEHIEVAAMTELPTSRQWRSDQISAVRGRGLVAESCDVRDPAHPVRPVRMMPSRAKDYRHSFASFSKFFPEGRVMTAQLEETLWERIVGLGSSPSPVIFDDQYISTGGQLYEIMCGHDRLVGDLRPYALRALGLETTLVCHPYDICTEMLAREAGCIVEHPLNGPVSAPMDTTTAVCWVAYPNEELARIVRPVLADLVHEIKLLAPRGMVRRPE
ncbi:MAG: inositol monophosphatase [Opitutales bacterium]|nr:inositol monophosphatase [Opitutales bacterium]